jgi:hypothetical protein
MAHGVPSFASGIDSSEAPFLTAFAISILTSPSIAETPYEGAARVDMEQLASSILAASVCKGAQFHGDAVIASVAAAMVLIGRKGAEDTFFSAIRANIDGRRDRRRAIVSASVGKEPHYPR